MRSTQQMSITLPVEMAKLIKERVANGKYATESEVIREGLRALQDREAAVERWLREEVAPTYDALVKDPNRSKDLKAVKAQMASFMDEAD